MNRWILKTDSEVYPFDKLEQERQAVWDGVSNPVALRHIRSMAPGDSLFIYHSGATKEIVGLARVISEPYPDPKRHDPKLVVVDIEADRRLPHPVSLATIKADPFFADLALVRQPRLSVIPVSEQQWDRLLQLASANPVPR
ncbi:MAG TPA: EVE domain-containing protein [Gemmatimonadales bacterium]|nr:EVE domain-containing protein [Gemmatimonadales bacterium]